VEVGKGGKTKTGGNGGPGKPWPIIIVATLVAAGAIAYLVMALMANPQIHIVTSNLAQDTAGVYADFKTVKGGGNATLDIQVQNIGSGTLHLTDISTQGDGFSVNPNTLDLPQGAMGTLHVACSPGPAGNSGAAGGGPVDKLQARATQPLAGTLEVKSNDSDHPEISINLKATARYTDADSLIDPTVPIFPGPR
jgi:hypothetical protein